MIHRIQLLPGQTLSYRKGLNVEQLRARAELYRPDGVTRLPHDEMPTVRVLRGEQFDRTEMLSRRPGRLDLLHFMISGSPLRDASGAITGAALVYHDISEARDTERKLQQAQRLDAIGKLTGGVAHDFNNMLTVITGTTETLVAGLKGQPALQAAAALIDQAAERCAELIQHLLAFARKQPLQPSNVDINAAVVDIAKLLRPTLGAQIEIETILEPGVAVAHIDRSQLANSVLNMAINSRDAMPAGGKLLLETRNVVLDEAYSQLNAEVKPGPYVMLAVSDTGTGMSPELCEQAFEPFFTTKEVGKGSGLGLSMVYGFVKQSGGHIRIYSEVGHGTTIRLYLPPALGATDMAGAAAVPATGGTETILVVEDDALVRNSAIAQLSSLGYSTVAAADGRSALNYVTSGKPFDLLFTDIIMPGGMTGRELADAVAELRPGTRVLYTSGYTDDAIVHHGRLEELDLAAVGKELQSLAARAAPPARLVIELGRYLVAQAGWYLTSVIAEQTHRGRKAVVVDGGVHQRGDLCGVGLRTRGLPPVLLDDRSGSLTPTDVLGCLSLPSDVLAEAKLLPPLSQGDVLAFPNAGAYGPQASPCMFHAHSPPAEVAFEGTRLGLLRPRLTARMVLEGQNLL